MKENKFKKTWIKFLEKMKILVEFFKVQLEK